MVSTLIYDNRKAIHEHEQYNKKFGTMYNCCKTDSHWSCMMFYPLFLIRRMIFVVILIAFTGRPEIQCNIFIITSFMVSTIKLI